MEIGFKSVRAHTSLVSASSLSSLSFPLSLLPSLVSRLVSSRLVLPPLQGALWHPRSQDRSIARACAYDKTRTKLEHATALVIFSGHHCVAALCCSIVSSANVSSPPDWYTQTTDCMQGGSTVCTDLTADYKQTAAE